MLLSLSLGYVVGVKVGYAVGLYCLSYGKGMRWGWGM